MSNIEIPSLEELDRTFSKLCETTGQEVADCGECRYLGCKANCFTQYVYDVLTFRADQNEPFEIEYDEDEESRQASWNEVYDQLKRGTDKPDANAKPSLPAWCKVGQWITISSEGLNKIVGLIEYIDGDGIATVSWYKGLTEEGRFNAVHCLAFGGREDFLPVKFRPYAYEEAKKLIGKAITVEDDEANFVRLIESVKLIKRSSTVLINYATFANWQSCNATIDGIPFGVPEVDYEALKEVAE